MMARAIAVPQDALLHRYVGQGQTYTDCFEVMHPLTVTLEGFIEAFYTTWLFRLERAVLTIGLRKRIKDSDVKDLATARKQSFAAWRVEDRGGAQILLTDLSGHTRSYLAVASKDGGVTRLIFGSAVVPPEGKPLAPMVRRMIPLHRFYSRALLRLAERKLRRG